MTGRRAASDTAQQDYTRARARHWDDVAASLAGAPNWSNVYNKVFFDLWTHSIPGISNLDMDLAKKIEALAQPLASK